MRDKLVAVHAANARPGPSSCMAIYAADLPVADQALKTCLNPGPAFPSCMQCNMTGQLHGADCNCILHFLQLLGQPADVFVFVPVSAARLRISVGAVPYTITHHPKGLQDTMI